MKEIKKIFTIKLLEYGFISKSNSWYYKNEELTIVINFQKSNYANSYFLDVGIWCNKIGGICEFPKENKCHLRFRAERLLNEIPDNLNPVYIFDFEKNILDRMNHITCFLEDYFCPLLEKFKSIRLIKDLYKNGLLNIYIQKDFKKILI